MQFFSDKGMPVLREDGDMGMIREYIIKISDEVMEDEIADKPRELIRCKDCQNFIWDGSYENTGMCNIGIGTGVHHRHSKNWFCANGKRETK